MVWANVSLFVRDTVLLFSFHHHVFTKHCFQPAQRSCGFLRKVCMICRAIINCQPYGHHCLPRLTCQASCTSPAICCRPPNVGWCHFNWFQFLKPVSFSTTWSCCEQFWTSHKKDRKDFASLSRSSCFFPFTDVLLTCPLAWHTQVSGRTYAFSRVQSRWRCPTKSKSLPKHYNELNIMLL